MCWIVAVGYADAPIVGAASHLAGTDIDRIMQHLAISGVLQEERFMGGGRFPIQRAVLGPSANSVFSSAVKVQFRQKSRAVGPETPAQMDPHEARIPPMHVKKLQAALGDTVQSILAAQKTAPAHSGPKAVAAHHIFDTATLQRMAKVAPTTKDEMVKVEGVGKAAVRGECVSGEGCSRCRCCGCRPAQV